MNELKSRLENVTMRLRTTVLTGTIGSLIALAPMAHADDLVSIFNLAVDNDPTYRAEKARRDVDLQAEDIARSALLPQFSASADITRVRQAQRHPNAAAASRNPDNFTTATYSLEMRQAVYQRNLWIELDQAKTLIKQAELEYAASRQDLMIRVARAYFAILEALDQVEFERANKQAIAQQLKQAQQRFDVGLIAITGVEEAKARFDLATAEEIEAINQLDNAREALQEITGQFHDDLAVLGPDVPLATPDPVDINAWTETALAQNLLIQANNASTAIAEDEIRRQQSGHYPSLSLVGRASRTNVDGGINPRRTPEGSLGLQLDVPLYSGGRVVAATEQARAAYQAALNDYEAIRRQVQRQTRESFLGIQASISRVQALNQAVVSNQSALDAVEAGFQVGTRTSVDVLDAQRELFDARQEFASARYAYILAILSLKQAAGTLSEDDIAAVNQWLTN
jgi:outer membrane protein